MADSNRLPDDDAPFTQDDITITPRDRSQLTLRAVNSADRLLNTLSPWIRESLTGERSPSTSGSLIRRLMRKRRGDSFTFNGTVGIMRRFHRIVNRSVAWQANVGTIDPGLFERFSLDMTRRRDIGANNITELLKLNRQEDALEMPLAGAPERAASPAPQQSAEPSRQLTFEEIKQRIEAARSFRSQSPSGQPDFVEAMRKRAETQAQTAPADTSSGQRPPMRPSSAPASPARPTPEQLPAPSPQPQGEQPNPAAMSPRARRRMGRKVEYLSIPKMGDADSDADSEPAPATYLALAPPDLPPTPPLTQDFFDELVDFDQPVDDVLIQRYVEAPARRRTAPARPGAQPAAIGTRSRQAVAPPPARSKVRHRRPPRPASMLARAIGNLTQSSNGSLLASRPQSLLSYIARTPGRTRPPSAPATLPPGDGVMPSIALTRQPSSPSPLLSRPGQPETAHSAPGDLPLAQRRLPTPATQPDLDLVSLQTQPLRALPTVSVRRMASPLPSPQPAAAATPSAPPAPVRSSTFRPAPPARGDAPVARQQAQGRRLVARPLPHPRVQPAAALPRLESLGQQVSASPTDLSLASPTLSQPGSPLIRRSAMSPASQLWQPSLINESTLSTLPEQTDFERGAVISRSTLLRQATGTVNRRMPDSGPLAGGSQSRPRPLGRGEVAADPVQQLPSLPAAAAPPVPLAPRPAAAWMPLEYTIQRLLQTAPRPSSVAVADTAPAPTPARRDAPGTVRHRRPSAAPTASQTPAVTQSPSTLLERVVRRDFARSRAAMLEDGALRLPSKTAVLEPAPGDVTAPAPSLTWQPASSPSTAYRTSPERTPELQRSPTTQPATTQPATTQPATTQPATTQPATTQPAPTQPAPTQPATTQPATTQPATTQPATTQPATTQPATTQPATTQPATTQPAMGTISVPVVRIESAQRTALLSQTLRQLAYDDAPVVDAPRRRGSLAHLQRSGARLRPPHPQSARRRAFSQPGDVAQTSTNLAALAARQPLAVAKLWRSVDLPATSSSDGGATMALQRVMQPDLVSSATPWATAEPSLASGESLPDLSLSSVGDPGVAPTVGLRQPQATFTPLDLPLRRLARLFTPPEEPVNVQPVHLNPQDTPSVQRRISQLTPSRRPVRARSLPASTGQSVLSSPLQLRPSTLPAPQMTRAMRAPLSSSPAAANPPTDRMSASTVRPSTASADNFSSPRRQDETPILPPDFAPFPSLTPDSTPSLRRDTAQPAVDRPFAGDSRRLPSAQQDRVASDAWYSNALVSDVVRAKATLEDRASGPASAPELPLVSQILSRDFDGLRQRQMAAPVQRAMPADVPREQRSALDATFQSDEASGRSPSGRASLPRTRRQWARQLRRTLLPTPSEKTVSDTQAQRTQAVSPPAHRRPWSAPPVSAAWPDAWNSPDEGSVWPSLLQRSADAVERIARSEGYVADEMPQAPFARHRWLRRVDGPQPEVSAVAIVEPLRSRPPIGRRQSVQRSPVQRTPVQPGVAQTTQQGSTPERAERFAAAAEAPSLPFLAESPSRGRNVAQPVARLGDDTPVANLVQRTSSLLSLEMPLRRLTATSMSSPVAAPMTGPTEQGSSAQPSPRSRQKRTAPALVETVVQRSFGDSRRRVLSEGPLAVGVAPLSAAPLSAAPLSAAPLSAAPLSAAPQAGAVSYDSPKQLTGAMPPSTVATGAGRRSDADGVLRSSAATIRGGQVDAGQVGAEKTARSVASLRVQRTTVVSSRSVSDPVAMLRSAPPAEAGRFDVDVPVQRAILTPQMPSAPLFSDSVQGVPALGLLPGVAASLQPPASAAALPPLVLRQLVASSMAAPATDQPAVASTPAAANVAPRGRRMTQTLLELVDRPPDAAGLPKRTLAPVQARREENSSHAQRLRAGEVARRTTKEVAQRRKQARLEPVSQIWRASLLRDAAPLPAFAHLLPPAQAGAAFPGAEGAASLNTDVVQRTTSPRPARALDTATVSISPQTPARFAPVELTLKRLLDRPVPVDAGTLPPPEQVLQRMEAGGWRFKRRSAPPPTGVEETQRGLAQLQRPAPARPIPEAPRTLLERVLERDFAGVRVQMAALGALGVEAATAGDTVYLPPSAARLDSPDTLALLGHELTHVAARLPQTVQRAPLDLPLAAPSLTRQLSQRLVQMSLAEEESTAEAVESTIRRAARGRAGAALRARPRAVVHLAQRKVDGRRFAPVSALWQGDGAPLLPPESALPAAMNPFAANPVATNRVATNRVATNRVAENATTSADVLETMQAEGWRFKRASGARATDVQTAAQTAQSLSARGGEMPLPVQPRSLLERVLQRDFSGVRMQVAGLEPLGVEAAARGNTVYLQRETAANLSAPQNLALLGHELTHVAAAGHAPVQRAPISLQRAAAPDLDAPLVQRAILPDLPSSRGSVSVEERTADQVEAGIRRMQQVQRSSAVAPAELPLSPLPLRARQLTGSLAAPSTAVLPPLTPPSTQNTIQRTVAPAALARSEDTSSVLSGVSSSSMPVAQRYHVPVQRNGADGGSGEEETTPVPSTPSLPVGGLGEKVTITAPRLQRDGDQEVAETEESEPDWEKLAEMLLPLLKDRLLAERDRLGW